jgi:hypothetical protein
MAAHGCVLARHGNVLARVQDRPIREPPVARTRRQCDRSTCGGYLLAGCLIEPARGRLTHGRGGRRGGSGRLRRERGLRQVGHRRVGRDAAQIRPRQEIPADIGARLEVPAGIKPRQEIPATVRSGQEIRVGSLPRGGGVCGRYVLTRPPRAAAARRYLLWGGGCAVAGGAVPTQAGISRRDGGRGATWEGISWRAGGGWAVPRLKRLVRSVGGQCVPGIRQRRRETARGEGVVLPRPGHVGRCLLARSITGRRDSRLRPGRLQGTVQYRRWGGMS